jgi:hypothetical protein
MDRSHCRDEVCTSVWEYSPLHASWSKGRLVSVLVSPNGESSATAEWRRQHDPDPTDGVDVLR